MESKKITCDHCGAVLTIEGTPKFVDCRYCGTSLRIVRTDSATFTEVRKAVKAIDARVSGLQKESKLRALDDHWRKQKEKLTIGHGHNGGHGTIPSKQFALVMGLLGGATSILMLVMGLSIGRDAVTFGIATAMVVATITVIGVSMILHRGKMYERAERDYLAQRKALEKGEPKAPKPSNRADRQEASAKSKARRNAPSSK